MGEVPIESVYQQIAQFAREAGAKRVILFGSRARGTNYPKSDIDLAIEGCPDFPAPPCLGTATTLHTSTTNNQQKSW